MKQSNTLNRLAIYLSWLAAIVFVLLPFHAFLTVWLSIGIGHYTLLRLWKELLLLVLLVGASYLVIKDQKLRRQFFTSKIVQLIGIYVAISLIWGLVALEFNGVTAKALGYGLIVNLRFLLFFLAIGVIATKSQLLGRVWSKLLLIPAIIVIFVGLVQRFFLPYDVLKHFGYNPGNIYPYETINHNVHYPRIMSTLRGSNPLGNYLLLILSAVAVLFTKNKNRRLILAVFGAAGLLALLFSYSRGAWVGLIISLLFLVWHSLKTDRSKRLFEAGLLALIIICAALAIALRHNVTFENYFLHTDNVFKSSMSSNAGHRAALRGGLHDITHNPIGSGVGTAGPASFYNHRRARIAENYFIQIGQEVGWLGLALFLAIYYLVARELWERRVNALALVLFASLIGITFVNLISHAWTDDTLAYIWWGLAGIALASRPVHH